MNRPIAAIVLTFLASLSGLVSAACAAEYDWMKKQGQPQQSSQKLAGQYLLFRAGIYFPEVTSDGGNIKMNNGKGAEAGYGIQPLKWLAAEASFGFIEADNYDDDLNNRHTTIQMVPVMATVRAILPLRQFDLYALAGGGMYYTMYKQDNFNRQEESSIDDDKVLLGYHYGGGISMQLGAGSSLGVEARRIDTSWDDLDIGGTFLTAFFRLGF